MRVLTSKQIIIPDASGNPIPIQAKNIFKPRQNLGHHKSPGGNSKTQVAIIKKKAKQISQAIQRTRTTRDEARMMYESVYRPAVEYPLAQSFVPETHLELIEKITLPVIYSKCGYNRNTA